MWRTLSLPFFMSNYKKRLSQNVKSGKNLIALLIKWYYKKQSLNENTITVLATIIEKASAKLNLSLDVLGKQSGGFYEVETVMAMVDLADYLTFILRSD